METSSHDRQAREESQGMSTATNVKVKYAEAARRHLHDAETLYERGRHANAGQLFGFAAESGLKAVLVACGVPTDADGGISQRHRLRQHFPILCGRLVTDGHLVPDGRFASVYMAQVSCLGDFHDWLIDHRYWADAALPIASVSKWRLCAGEIMAMLDQASEDGVLR